MKVWRAGPLGHVGLCLSGGARRTGPAHLIPFICLGPLGRVGPFDSSSGLEGVQGALRRRASIF
jgi:hypothetical protein